LEGKTTDDNPSGVDSSSKNPEFGMPLNFYDNQGLYAAANKGKLVSSSIEIDKTGLAGRALSNQVVVYGQNLARNTRTDQGPTSRASMGQNILPNPPKSPNQVPILDDTPAAPVVSSTNFNDTLNRFRKELSKSLEESLGVQIKPSRTTYRKPYHSHFDFMKAPDGWKVPDFNKFSGDDSKSTMEHISMFLAQLDEVSAYDFMKVRNFPLSLTDTAFAWFTSSPACSIGSWAELEEKFHSHFYTNIHETRLSHLASVHQGRDKSVLDFVKRFREIKNRCFHLMISKRDLTDLCFASLCPSIRDKLEHYEFVNVDQLLQRVVSAESRLKESRETYKSNRHNVHIVDDHSDCSDEIVRKFALLKLNGQQRITWLPVHLSNRFIRIGVKR
jgi:hypothetical protein